jgi:hypothetical protein
MTPFIARAGLAGLSSDDELWLTGVALVFMVLQALFLPIFTFDHPPQWMIWLQPGMVMAGLIAVHSWLRARKARLFKRLMLYAATYCLLLFATNMAGEARGLFRLAGHFIDQARLISEGRGYPADTRP